MKTTAELAVWVARSDIPVPREIDNPGRRRNPGRRKGLVEVEKVIGIFNSVLSPASQASSIANDAAVVR